MEAKKKKGIVLQGIGVSPGIRIGRAQLIDSPNLSVPMQGIEAVQVENEMERFASAVDVAIKQIRNQKNRIDRQTAENHYYILEAHELMLQDNLLNTTVERFIRKHLFNAEWALKLTVEQFISEFDKIDDEHIRKRKADLLDVNFRVFEALMGVEHKSFDDIESGAIIVTRYLSPGDASNFYTQQVGALALEVGGKASHIAIISRSMNIPAVLGLEGLMSSIQDGDEVILDGTRGLFFINPTQRQYDDYRKKEKKHEQMESLLLSQKAEPALLLDGPRITLKGNIESLEEIPALFKYGAEGIGLFRTEFMYMGRSEPPTEEEHYQYYRRLVRLADVGPVTIRTHDIGGDKRPSYWAFPKETNPALGSRAIRAIHQNDAYFRAQVRAIYRAAAHGEIKLLLPFISGVAELEWLMGILDNIKKELDREKVVFNPDVPLGVMIELPSAAIVSDSLAKRVQFFSIGTNDLIQYTLAVDRDSEQLAHMFTPLHPAILRLLRSTCDNAHQAGIDVALCGEMASEMIYTLLLVGLGITELGMPPSSIPYVKEIIRRSTMEQALWLTREAMQFDNVSETELLLHAEMSNRFPEFFGADM